MKINSVIVLVLACGSLCAAGTQPAPVVDNPASIAKTVRYAAMDEIPIKTKLRFTTLIVLPKNEKILDFACGDKEFWIINGNQNFAYVKPAKAGAKTNLNLVTASGNIYSFVLTEVSQMPKADPDLKVFVELKDDAMATASQAEPRFVSSAELDTYKEQLKAVKEQTRLAQIDQQRAIDKGIHQFVAHVRFAYRFEAGKKPFYVRAMYHDDRFTYIQARPEETPTLYEVKDGHPNMVNFEYQDGVYVVDKILDRGYLIVGKQKLGFTREE